MYTTASVATSEAREGQCDIRVRHERDMSESTTQSECGPSTVVHATLATPTYSDANQLKKYNAPCALDVVSTQKISKGQGNKRGAERSGLIVILLICSWGELGEKEAKRSVGSTLRLVDVGLQLNRRPKLTSEMRQVGTMRLLKSHPVGSWALCPTLEATLPHCRRIPSYS
eukprot:1194712-Prorocentrum_minimum.AAC.3